MICPTCGHDNPAGSRFCVDCQAFLAWDADAAGASGERAAPASPAPRSGERASSAETAGAGDAADGRASAAATGAPVSGTAVPETAAARRSEDGGAVPDDSSRRPDTGTGTTGRPPRVPDDDADVSGPTPDTGEGAAAGRTDVPETVGARRPDEREEAPRVAADTVAVPVVPAPPSTGGDGRPERACPRCGADNPPERHLCASCGTPLEPPRRLPSAGGPARAGRTPWLRWWMARRERAARADRRQRPRVRRRLRAVWPVVVPALAVAGWFARHELAGLVTLVHDRTTKQAALHPDTYAASSAAPGHPAKLAFDGFSNRYWAPAAPGKGTGQYVEAGFHHSVRLETILITPGCSVDDGTFLTQARPARITLTLTSSDGRTTRRTLSLDDQAGPQKFTVHASGTVRIRLTTDASYGAGRGRRVAVTEVEFFGRR